jgi:hypothetical protein
MTAYSSTFLAGLLPEGRAVLSRDPHTIGTDPIVLLPGVGGALEGYGVVLDQASATPASRTTELANPAGAEPTRYPRIRIVSTAGAGGTAGLFGIPSIGRIFAASVGWCARWITGGALSTLGRGGDLFGRDFSADGTFSPERVQGGFGWVKASGAAQTWRWYAGDPGETVACTGAALASDARRYDHVMVVPRQDPLGVVWGYALLIDLTDPLNPVVVDERRFVVPAAAEPKGIELNRSPGPGAGAPQTAVELAFYGFWASLGVEASDVNATLPDTATWASIGRLTPTLAGTNMTTSAPPLSFFPGQGGTPAPQFFPGNGGQIAATNVATTHQRVAVSQDGRAGADGFGCTVGSDVADPAAQVFSLTDGFQLDVPCSGLASGIATANAQFGGPIILARSIGAGLPFPQPPSVANTIFVGVTSLALDGLSATPAGDIDFIVVSSGGVRSRRRLVGARSDNMRLFRLVAQPGGGRVELTVYDPATGAVWQDFITTNLPTGNLAYIANANSGSSGTVSYALGRVLWGRTGTPGANMLYPQAFTAEAVEPWMELIPDADLRAMVIEGATGRATPWDAQYGPDGAGGLAGYGIAWTTLAPSTANGTDPLIGDYAQLDSGLTEGAPAGSFGFPAGITDITARPLLRRQGYYFDAITEHGPNFGVAGVRGVLGVLGHGDFGAGTLDTSELIGATYADNRSDIVVHTRTSYGGAAASQVVISPNRPVGSVWRTIICCARDSDRIGVIVYRIDTNQLLFAAWLTANLPPLDAPAYPEVNASGGVGGGTLPVRRLRFRVIARTRDTRERWR